MKTQMTLQQMAAELERQQSAKRDFVADTRKLEMVDPDHLRLETRDGLEVEGITNHAHSQIASDLKIPAVYYNRLRETQPDLLTQNVNTLWQREPKKRLVRTLDGKARAVVSDKFSVDYDNFDLMNFLLPELQRYPGLQFNSIGMTETRLYVKAFYPSIQAEVKKGDIVRAGFVFGNSEVGDGSIFAYPMTETLACLNGMILMNMGKRRHHVGKRLATDDEAFELYSDETRRADSRAFFLKIRDTIRNILTQDTFEKIVASLREAADVQIEGSVEGAVEIVQKTFSLTQGSSDGVLRHLIEGRDLSIYGLANAVTRQSQDEEDYEVATSLERTGGRIIELPKSSWKEIIQADRPIKRAA